MSLWGTAGRVSRGPACLESMPPDPTGMRGSTAPSARRLAGGGRFGVAIVLHPAPRGAGRPDMPCSDFREGLGLSSNPVAMCVVEQPPTWPCLCRVMVSLGLPRSTGIKCPSSHRTQGHVTAARLLRAGAGGATRSGFSTAKLPLSLPVTESSPHARRGITLPVRKLHLIYVNLRLNSPCGWRPPRWAIQAQQDRVRAPG